MPLERANATLRRLGDPGGVKRTLPVPFDAGGIHLDEVNSGTVTGGPATVTELCSP